MAFPTVPTVLSLVTEAYGRCGVTQPTTPQLTRATDEWFEDVKRDIAGRKAWHSDEETLVVIPEAFIQVYALPTPLIRILRVRFYRGTIAGTAQAGGIASLTVASGTGNVQHRGLKMFLIGGTGVAQSGRIVAVSGDIYSMSCNWDTQPDNTTTYLIAEVETQVTGPQHVPLDGVGPSSEMWYWNFLEHHLQFWPPVDDANLYALEVDGIVDISLIDSADVRITRLLREWREALVRGVMVHIKEDHDDLQDVDRAERKYEKAVMIAMKQDTLKRLRGEAPAFRSIGGAVSRRGTPLGRKTRA